VDYEYFYRGLRALFGSTVDWEWFYCVLHYLGILFTKSSVDWSGVITELPLSQRVAKTPGGGVVFLVGEKMISSGLGGAAGPKLQTPGVGLPSPGC